MQLFVLRSKEGANPWVSGVSRDNHTITYSPHFEDALTIQGIDMARGFEAEFPVEKAVLDADCVTKEYTKELVHILEKLDRVAPVQFLDEDSESVLNYIGVRLDELDGSVYVRLSRYYDNLPAHRENPLKNSQGQIIPPKTWSV